MSDSTSANEVTDEASATPGDQPDPTASTSKRTPDRVSTRLRRSREQRVIAGVAGGIAERFDVNENLVRIVFAVLTLFWGLGVAIYLVMWVVVPLADADATPRRPGTPVSTSHRLTFALLASLVVVVGLMIAVARHVGVLAPGLAAAWVVFLLALAIIAVKTPARRLTIRRVAGVVLLAVVSLVIVVVGSVMGFLESTGVTLAGGNGDFVWQPTSLTQVARGYHVEFGAGTVDLSAVDFPVTGSAVSASVGVGELQIVVPANAVVSLTTNVGIGIVTYQTDTPMFIRGVATQHYTSLPAGVSAAQARRDPHLVIDARVGIGRIALMRAVVKAS